MAQIIDGVYAVQGEIGSGGGGVVYLAQHLRLGKQVVLKADKRTISASPEALRREVDALKNLSHTYIPQVYDFIVEGNQVYTVMDYIEGESFDKLLNRGARFSQAQVVAWACQLLEALCYLHSRPPHGILHGDIKPANIMLTPQNEIRLIDFNIALALGENGAVKVGYSQGYASPEHYGVEYPRKVISAQGLDSVTETIGTETETMTATQPSSSGAANQVLLDIRSDIYSLGATLYHLLTGRRPAVDANAVVPIAETEASPAVIAILAKAMAPQQERRYQSAQEMLTDVRGLHANDPRTKRLHRARLLTAAALVTIFLVGGVTAFVGLKQMEQVQSAYALAEKSARVLREGDPAGAIDLALKALPDKTGLFTPPSTPQAQKALSDALGVYDLSDGYKVHGAVELQSEPTKLVLSPDGKTAAALCAGELVVINTQTAQVRLTLPADSSALADVLFADANTIVFAGEGGLIAYDLEKETVLWRGGPTTGIALSGDRSTVATVYLDENKATVYEFATGEVRSTVSFGDRAQSVPTNDGFADPEDSLFALNEDGTLLAVSFRDGGLLIYDLRDPSQDLEIYDQSDYTHFEGGFFDRYFAFSSTNQEESLFAVIDTVEAVQTGGFASENLFGVQADESGIYVSTEDVAVKIHPETGEQEEVAYLPGFIRTYARGEDHTLVAGQDKTYAFFDRQANQMALYESDYPLDFLQLAGPMAVLGSLDTPTVRLMRLENHPETQVFSYDPSYEHDEARLNADGTTVMLFRYDQFRLYGMDGAVICDVDIANPEQVYDQQYRRDEKGSYLEVTYYDGLVRSYSAEDGGVLSEVQGAKPDESLYEEFFTDTLRITSPLHGTPVAYDRKTGKRLCELEKDSYLTYVTQVGDYVVTEYVSAEGQRYGLLIDESCETLARLPNLCDIVDGALLFDYHTGDLRKTKIYSLDELISLGREGL